MNGLDSVVEILIPTMASLYQMKRPEEWKGALKIFDFIWGVGMAEITIRLSCEELLQRSGMQWVLGSVLAVRVTIMAGATLCITVEMVHRVG